MIKAPYNFVPLENRAFYPSWANHISQDIPFEDGVSGSIEYTIEAETPIFVRMVILTERIPTRNSVKHLMDNILFLARPSRERFVMYSKFSVSER